MMLTRSLSSSWSKIRLSLASIAGSTVVSFAAQVLARNLTKKAANQLVLTRRTTSLPGQHGQDLTVRIQRCGDDGKVVVYNPLRCGKQVRVLH